MKHLMNEECIYRLSVLKDLFGDNIKLGRTVLGVIDDLLRDLVKDGFTNKEILSIVNFILYEYDIKFRAKYHYLYYYINHKILNKQKF